MSTPSEMAQEQTEGVKKDFKSGHQGRVVARRTKTPIVFKDLGPNDEGTYDPASPIAGIKLLMSSPKLLAALGKGVGTLNPNATDFNLGRDTRHEEVHALMDNLPAGLFENPTTPGSNLAQQIPGYFQIAQQLVKSRAGNMSQEVPAYAATNDPAQTGVPADWMTQYIGMLKNGLAQINPQLGQTLGLLSQNSAQ
jgi:hypothetical protein